MQFEFVNQSGENINNFNVQINKNSFGVQVDGPASKHGITYPAPFETSTVQNLPLKIDKNNVDKSSPKNPFNL